MKAALIVLAMLASGDAAPEAIERVSENGPIKATVRVEPASPLLGDPVTLILTVEAEPPDATTLADLARGRSIVHEAQGHAEQSSRRYRLNGLDAWEGVYRATLRGDEVVFHDVLLMGTGTLMDISLTTYADRYADEVSELTELLGSIEATGRDEPAAP